MNLKAFPGQGGDRHGLYSSKISFSTKVDLGP
jgi:hypothetical protein